MKYFNQSLDLPYTNSTVKYRELTTNEQIILSKTNLSLPYTNIGLYEYFEVLNDVIQNCVKDQTAIEKLDVIEYVMFITKLRSISIGNTIEFMVENSNDESFKKQKIIINLNLFIKSLYEATQIIINESENNISEKNISVILKWPSIKNIKNFLNPIDLNNINSILIEFIKEIKLDNASIDFSNFKQQEKQDLLEKLSIGLKQKVEKKIFSLLENLINKNLIGIEQFKDQKFNIFGFGFVSFLRLFFSYDIRSLYQEIHYLAGSGLSPDYILNVSPSERKLYISITNDANKAKQGSSASPEDMIGNSKTLEDLAVEFNQQI